MLRATDPDDINLMADLELGESTKLFLSTDLGKHFIARAENDIANALVEFQNSDPDDAKKMRDIRFRIDVARKILNWLDDAIMRGDQAYQIAISKE